jgi:antimicrobial peptide system SdpA family protein
MFNETVLSLPGQTEVSPILRALFPQGWAFFTKPGRAENLVPYAVYKTGLKTLSPGAYAEPRNGFGFDRSYRRQGVELARLLVGIPKATWTQCQGLALDACASRASTSVRASNTLKQPTVCGHVVLVAVSTTPWEWRHLLDEPRVVNEVVKLDVRCTSR